VAVSRLIDWLRNRPLEAWVSAVLVVGSVVFVFLQLQPHLLFLDTTPAGGDMGAHVWGPAYLREELLPRLRLSGWAPDWYDGFPAYQFYMVVPSLLIVFLDVVLFVPYNIAFKLIAVSGLLALPVAAWALGKLARLPFPMPAALAVATVPFIFDRSFSIYGGNAASTLAGEFAFTISLVFALVFLGVVLRGLETGRSRALAAVLLALTVCCHLIPAIFAVIGAGVALLMAFTWTRRWAAAAVAGALLLLGLVSLVGPTLTVLAVVVVTAGAVALNWRDRDELLARYTGNRLRAWWVASVVGVGALLTGFWTIPFVLRRQYMTDMGWEKLPNYWQPLFPGHVGDRMAHIARGASSLIGHHPAAVGHPVLQAGSTTPADMTLVILLALLGVGTSIVYRRRFGIWVSLVALTLAVVFVKAPQGRLWNARLLPFWYLCLYLLAAIAVVELVTALAVLARKDQPSRAVLVGGPIVAALLTIGIVALPLRSLPFGHTSADGATYSWLGLVKTGDKSVVPDWAKWNFSGYEKKAAYPEYQDVVSAMRKVGEQRGCGRAMWEYSGDLDRFGTPMALMLLPYWTEGCIGSMEGLYFEASATTPYHFVNQSELSAAPSRAERGLPYGNLDITLGVDHLQLMGVKYYMAFSDSAVAAADKEPDLKLVSSTGKWHVYEVAHSELVQPLANQPAVVKGVPKTSKGWEKMAVDWYLDRSRWGVMLAADGPSPWERVDPTQTPLEKGYSKTTVSDLVVKTDKISFTVDRTGAPILVKASYFPNWKVKNAEGPFRVAPNLMVVVPTDNLVTLEYGRTSVDWFGILSTLGGIALAIGIARRRRLRIPPRPPRAARQPDPVPPSPWSDDVLATVGGGEGLDRERWGPPPDA
jgi:uncharacterized membrane protein